jgi:hypothetical protein
MCGDNACAAAQCSFIPGQRFFHLGKEQAPR